jgi:hypothetical protein
MIKFQEAQRALLRILSGTNRYLYPDRYIKMIPYYLYLHLKKCWHLTLSPRASILWRSSRYLGGDRYTLLVTVLCRRKQLQMEVFADLRKEAYNFFPWLCWLLGHLGHSGDLLLSVFVRRCPSYVVRKLLNIFSFFSGTAEPISTRFGI